MALLVLNKQACSRCGIPIEAVFPTSTETICEDCFKDPPPFLRCFSPYLYLFPLDQLIATMKYQRKPQLSRLLAALMTQHLTIEAQGWPEALIPIPMHRKKQRQRGFNQAIYLANQLGKQLNIPVLTSALQKTQSTLAQNSLSASQRRHNLKGAFSVTPSAKQQLLGYEHIGIVDDVITTTATMREAAACLRAIGVTEVSAWSIARTP